MFTGAPGERVVTALTAAMIILLLISGHMYEAILLAALAGAIWAIYLFLVKKLA